MSIPKSYKLVPVELLERVATEANHMLGFTYAANYDECRSAVDELRAMIDTPASPKAAQPVAWEVTGADGHTVTPQYPKWAEGDVRLTVKALVHADTHADAGEVEALKLNLKYAEEGSASFAAEADALQKQVNTLRAQLAERDALLTDLGVEPDGVSDVYQRLLLNAERCEYLREHMVVENFPSEHPSWSWPSEYESRRIDELCDSAMSRAKAGEADHE